MNSKKLMVRLTGITGLILLCTSLSGCAVTSGAAFGAASGAMAAKGVGNDFKYYVFDVPPQVVYRIDDHRFFTLENYKDCEHGGIVYYNDTNKNIKEYINGGSDSNSILKANPMMSWKGQFIYAASENTLAYIDRFPQMSDRDKNSGVFLSYLIGTDNGKVRVGSDSEIGLNVVLVVTDGYVYIKSPGMLNIAYSLPARNINSFHVSYDYPTSAEGGKWPKASTPSGEKYLTCDNLIKPTKVSVTSEQLYASDATGIPKHEQ